MWTSKVLFCGSITALAACSSEFAGGNNEEKTVSYFPIPKGCREYTEEFFTKRLVGNDVQFYVQEFRVKFDSTSSVEAIGVLEGPPRIDDIRLSRLISEAARGCYPDTYVELDIRDDVDAFELGVDLKHSLSDRTNISSIVIREDKVRVYLKNHKTVTESLKEGEMTGEHR